MTLQLTPFIRGEKTDKERRRRPPAADSDGVTILTPAGSSMIHSQSTSVATLRGVAEMAGLGGRFDRNTHIARHECRDGLHCPNGATQILEWNVAVPFT